MSDAAVDPRLDDAATTLALEHFPEPPADAPEPDRRVWPELVSAYRDALLNAWTDPQHRRAILDARASAGGADGPEPRPVGVLMRDVHREVVAWLWSRRIPGGKVTLLEGDPDEGKSTLALDFAARVSTGKAMPFDTASRSPAGVVVLNAEDGLGDTIRPRLEAAGADLSRVLGFAFEEQPEIPGSLEVIEDAVRRIDAALVIVDPLMAFLADRVESHRDHHVRRALAPLAALAQRTGAAVIAIRHLNKSGGTNAKYRGGGSIGITGAARSVMLAAPDPEDAARKILARVKGNLAAPWPAIAYRLVPVGEAVRIQWIEETHHTAAALLATEGEEERSALEEAKRLLTEQLGSGPAEASEVKKALRAAGVAPRTLDRAKTALGVRARPDGYQGRWRWSLPEYATDASVRQGDGLAHSGEVRRTLDDEVAV